MREERKRQHEKKLHLVATTERGASSFGYLAKSFWAEVPKFVILILFFEKRGAVLSVYSGSN